MFERNERLTELIQQQISELLRSVKDPGLSGFITLTGATLSKDRKKSTIYYSLIGTPEERESTAKALERAAPFLRHQLKSRLTLKYIPEIEFEYDQTPERAQRVDAILEQLKYEAEPAPAAAPPDAPSAKKASRSPAKAKKSNGNGKSGKQ